MMFATFPTCHPQRYSYQRRGCRYPSYQPATSLVLRNLVVGDEAETKAAASEDAPHQLPTSYVVYRNGNLEVSEFEHYYSFQFDLPGVKAADVSLKILEDGVLFLQARRTLRGSKNADIKRKVSFDETSMDAATATANMVDGVLEVTFPKKTQESKQSLEPVNIDIIQGNAPEEEKFKTVFTTDLPGVSKENVKLTFKEDHLWLQAERTRNGQVLSNICRIIPVNVKKMDTTKMEAYLADGVLEVTALEKAPLDPIVIPVTSKPSATSLPLVNAVDVNSDETTDKDYNEKEQFEPEHALSAEKQEEEFEHVPVPETVNEEEAEDESAAL